MEVFTGLLHDAPARPDVAAHRTLGQGPYGWAVGPLVIGDDRLNAVADDGAEIEVSVLTGTGAGGLVALGRRRTGLRVVAAETVLRDLDDLATNAARVVSAAAGLPEGVDVYVGIPGAPGLVEAVETVEAAGLLGRVDLAAEPPPHGSTPAEVMSVLVEADLPFKVCGLRGDAFGPYGVASVLMAVEALVDGAEADEAQALLAGEDAARMRGGLARWDAAAGSRVRRRLRGVDCADLAGTLESLGGTGLLDRAS